jgi:hypothetical protein
MKNVTITMEDHVADWARVEAAKRNQSLSRMLGDLLAEKMRRDDAYDRAMHDWQGRARTWQSDGSAYPSRESTYERGRGSA